MKKPRLRAYHESISGVDITSIHDLALLINFRTRLYNSGQVNGYFGIDALSMDGYLQKE